MRASREAPGPTSRTILVLFLSVLPAAARSQLDCPTISLCCTGSEGCSNTTEPQGQIYCQDGGVASAIYDLVRGTLHASANGTVGINVSVRAQDDFVITGLAPGTALTFKARLDVGGSACGFAGADASLGEGGSVVQAHISGSSCSSKSHLLEVTLTHLVGENFRLTVEASAGGVEYGTSAITAILSFVDLPPEAVVTSCHGFRQEFPTPVRAVTWGQLKARYR